jgi:hypothetical protein
MEPKIEPAEEIIREEGFNGLNYLSSLGLIGFDEGEKCLDLLVHKVRFNTMFISRLGLDYVP